MSKAQPTLSDFASGQDADDDGEHDDASQTPAETAGWRAEPPRCQCGADLENWHSAAEARRMVRQFGRKDGTVPACPACTEYSHPSGDMTGVARAIRVSDRTATADRLSGAEWLELRTRDGVRR